MFIAGGIAAASAARNRRRNNNNNYSDSDIDRNSTPIESSTEKIELKMDILKSMFKEYEEDVLFLLLQNSGYCVENTIDNILVMDTNTNTTNTNTTDLPLPPNATTTTTTTEPRIGIFTLEEEDDEEEGVMTDSNQEHSHVAIEVEDRPAVLGNNTLNTGTGIGTGIVSDISYIPEERKDRQESDPLPPIQSITDEELAFMLQVLYIIMFICCIYMFSIYLVHTKLIYTIYIYILHTLSTI